MDVTDEPVTVSGIIDPAGIGVPPSVNWAFYDENWNLLPIAAPVKRPSLLDRLNPFSAFVALDNLYTKNGGVIYIPDVRIDSNTGRILYTLNGDTRDITDTLTSDEQTVLQQSAPSHQFNSPVPANRFGIQPYQWILIAGGLLLTSLLILRRR